MVLKLSIHTSALPQQQRSHWGLRVTQDAYFLLLTHTKQLLLVTVCDTLAGTEVSIRKHEHTERTEQNDRWTDRRGSRNSYLDVMGVAALFSLLTVIKLSQYALIESGLTFRWRKSTAYIWIQKIFLRFTFNDFQII